MGFGFGLGLDLGLNPNLPSVVLIVAHIFLKAIPYIRPSNIKSYHEKKRYKHRAEVRRKYGLMNEWDGREGYFVVERGKCWNAVDGAGEGGMVGPNKTHVFVNGMIPEPLPLP